jgi:hypothetical protein
MVRHRRKGAALLSAALLVTWAPGTAFAQTKAPSATQVEARTRFDQGIKLFNDGDNAGALAAFQRAYQLIPNPLVLYNIGLVYAAMGRPVDAVAALDELLANPGTVASDKVTRARETRDQQAQRVAELSVATNVPATLEIDGIGVGQTPLAAPIRVSGGVHVVGAVASGYLPTHKEITVAGGTKETVSLALAPMQTLAAHVTLRSHLPGADVFVDGQASGRTPLAQSLTLPPGDHVIELRREGYGTARQDLHLGDGATAELDLDPQEDRAAVLVSGGTLAIEASEPNPVVTIDGTARGVYTGSFTLAPGEHHLIVERGGFEPKEADAVVYAHKTSTVRVVLDPTPETRADYEHARAVRHTEGILVAAGGLLLAGGSVAFIVWNKGQVNQLTGPYNTALANEQMMRGVCATRTQEGDAMQCNALVTNSYSSLKSAENLTPVGYIGLGVGAAVTVTGVVLFFTAGRADRFSHPATAALSPSWSVLPWADPHGAGMGATVRF